MRSYFRVPNGTLLIPTAMVLNDEKPAPNRWSEGGSRRICRRQQPPFGVDPAHLILFQQSTAKGPPDARVRGRGVPV